MIIPHNRSVRIVLARAPFPVSPTHSFISGIDYLVAWPVRIVSVLKHRYVTHFLEFLGGAVNLRSTSLLDIFLDRAVRIPSYSFLCSFGEGETPMLTLS